MVATRRITKHRRGRLETHLSKILHEFELSAYMSQSMQFMLAAVKQVHCEVWRVRVIQPLSKEVSDAWPLVRSLIFESYESVRGLGGQGRQSYALVIEDRRVGGVNRTLTT